MLNVLHVPAFQDNYIWIIRTDNRVAIIDPGDAVPVLAWLARENLTPTAILCTHNHHDHVDGVQPLAQHYPDIPVYGPAQRLIPGVNRALREGDELALPDMGIRFQIWETPGHTPDHIVYYGHGALFCGDTLFSAGCGRLFKGLPNAARLMHHSLGRLASLPDDTAVYCAHEYTESNLGFALAVEPRNPDMHAHLSFVQNRRAQQQPSLPSTLLLEKQINPFLRTHRTDVRLAAENYARRPLPVGEDVFSALRQWKNEFR